MANRRRRDDIQRERRKQLGWLAPQRPLQEGRCLGLDAACIMDQHNSAITRMVSYQS